MKLTSPETACAIASPFAFGFGLWASGLSSLSPLTTGDLDSPVLAAELVRSAGELASIVGPAGDPQRSLLRSAFIGDYGFIVAYATLFVFVGCVIRARGFPWIARLLWLLVAVAVVCDSMENREVLLILDVGSGAPRPWSIAKWTVLFAAMGCVVWAYLDATVPPFRRAIGYWAAGLSALAAFIGLLGVVSRTDPMIESGGHFMVESMVVGAIYFATHRFLARGLVRALDRLTSWGWLRFLARWPSDGDDDELPPEPK